MTAEKLTAEMIHKIRIEADGARAAAVRLYADYVAAMSQGRQTVDGEPVEALREAAARAASDAWKAHVVADAAGIIEAHDAEIERAEIEREVAEYVAEYDDDYDDDDEDEVTA